MKFIFKFNKEEDLENIYREINLKNEFVSLEKRYPAGLLNRCRNESFEDCRMAIQNEFKKYQEFAPTHLESVEKSWRTIEDEFLKRIELLFGKLPKFQGVFVNLTTGMLGWFYYDKDYPSISLSYFRNINHSLKTIGHETMHIFFQHFYRKRIVKELGKRNYYDLLEALTVLLNEEFIDLWGVVDEGYIQHKDLRNHISKWWREEKNFKILTEKCVHWMTNKKS